MPADHPATRLIARVPDWAILLVFCLVFSLQVISSILQKSATFDEPVNLASGYVALRFGDHRIMPQNLPLVKLLAALPLLLADVRMPAPPHPWTDASRYAFAHSFLYEVNDADRLLLLGRLALLPLALLLGGLVFRWTRQLFGRPAAAAALGLYCFEPSILAHAGLVTTDLAVTCLMFGTVYGLYRVAQDGIALRRLLLPGLALGLALLTKFTLLPFLFILLLLALAASLARQPLALRLPGLPPGQVEGRGRKLAALLLVLLGWGMVAYGVIWALYGLSYEATVTPGFFYPASWSEILPRRPALRTALLWMRETRLLPEEYLYGLSYLVAKSGKFVTFLMGEVRFGSWWYFFLVTFLIKTPAAFLLLIAVGLGVQGRRWREDPLCAAFLLLPVLVYFTLISVSGWNIGHRHLLPIYPFLCVLVGGLVPWAQQSARGGRWVQTALAAWYLAAALWIAPHYLAYFNELVGGPTQGYKYLVDSNLDWGQDLKGLKRYMDAHGIDRVWLSYFGSASPDYYGIRYNYLPSYHIFKPSPDRLPTSFVAISATNLQGLYLLGNPDAFKAFREREPIAKVGYSLFIYRLD